MQHIRDLDSRTGNEESFFVESKSGNRVNKGKKEMSLEEALREASLQEGRMEGAPSRTEILLGEDMLPSQDLKQRSYQDQQDVPDALARFQPDMDPRLCEVLQALDDEAYLDDEEDFVADITQTREEIDQKDFESAEFPDDPEDDGWESDTTEKPSKEFPNDSAFPASPSSTDLPSSDTLPPDHGDGDWMKEFNKFKTVQKSTATKVKTPQSHLPADIQSSLHTGVTSLASGRRKKRKGAMTSSTGYSMTSSSLARTEGLELLDARFDKIEEEYADDGDGEGMELDMDDAASMYSKDSKLSHFSGASRLSNMSASSQALELTSIGFEGLMDEFLGGYSMSGKKRVKKGAYQSGVEQLDEVRKGLGPARVNAQRVR